MGRLEESHRKIAIIGASPVFLLYGLYFRQLGYQVEIFDKSAIGGAWAPSKIFGKTLDLGVHYLYYNRALRAATGLLNSSYDLGLINLTIPAIGDQAIFGQRHPEFSFGADRLRGWKLLRAHANIPYHLLRYARRGSDSIYFEGGCKGLMTRMRRLLGESGVSLHEHALVDLIGEGEAGDSIVTAQQNGSCTSRKFDFILISSRAIPRTLYGEETSHFYKEQVSIDSLLHLFLLIKNPGPPRYSFYKFVDEAIFGASDCRHYNLTEFGEDETVISVAFNKGMSRGEVKEESVFKKLQQREIIGPNANRRAAEFTSHPTLNADTDAIFKFNSRRKGTAQILQVNNLAAALADFSRLGRKNQGAPDWVTQVLAE